jgi:EAL domain-containing protein (putative c-di-GMP-specific phosphodiesterase class I)/GGDEF domain-containing protein
VKTYSAILGRLAAWNCEPAAVLLYIDLRNLRGINRISDAAEGDALIERLSATLNAWAGRNGLAGRLWSNEFIAVKVIDHTQGAIDEAMDLRDRLAQMRYRSPLGESEVSVAIGVNTVRPGVDWARAIAEAGEACEASKRRGLNQIVVHSTNTPKPRATANAGLVVEFRRLLAAGHLALHPQPIMDVRGEIPRLAKAEFLLRQEKNGVYMPIPAGTIETLEAFGLATELDRFSSNWILDWLSDNLSAVAKLDSVSINLSARSIVDGRFMDLLLRDVKSAHLPAGKLCFEITETAAIEHLDVAAEVIAAFHANGVGFSLDDFGSGLCSFGYLQRLQVDEVKIDGRFISDVATGGAAQAIVRAIHQVAHATGKRTVAEFVDDPRKLAALREIGVDYAQGWLFYPTVTPEKFVELLEG